MDGLKAKLSFDAVAYDYDDEYLTIDTDTHTININNVSRLFGVQFDGNSKLIKFKIRNKLSDIQKMQDSIVYINWIDSRGVKGQSIAINKAINNDTCEFAWKVPFDALKNSGVLHFAMSAVVTKNSSSVIDQRWTTQIASVITPDGIYIKSYTPSSEEEDRIAQIYTELSNMINKQNDNLQSQVNSLKEDVQTLSNDGRINIEGTDHNYFFGGGINYSDLIISDKTFTKVFPIEPEKTYHVISSGNICTIGFANEEYTEGGKLSDNVLKSEQIFDFTNDGKYAFLYVFYSTGNNEKQGDCLLEVYTNIVLKEYLDVLNQYISNAFNKITIVDGNIRKGYYVNNDGHIYANNKSDAHTDIKVRRGYKIRIKNAYCANNRSICAYNENGDYVKTLATNTGESAFNAEFDVDDYDKISVTSKSNDEIVIEYIGIIPVQATDSLCESIDERNATSKGTGNYYNMPAFVLNQGEFTDGYLAGDSVFESTSLYYSPYISVFDEQVITLKNAFVGGFTKAVFYDADKKYIGHVKTDDNYYTATYDVRIPYGAHYMRFNVNKETDFNLVGVEYTQKIERNYKPLNLVKRWYSNSYEKIDQLFKKATEKPICCIIDDDSPSADAMETFATVMESNGVQGTIACLTAIIDSQQDLKSKLLELERRGHQVVLHGYTQNEAYKTAKNVGDANYKIAEDDFVHGLHDLISAGFVDCKFWVTPYGVSQKCLQQLARKWGMECLITTAKKEFNRTDGKFSRYEIQRSGLNAADTGTLSQAELIELADKCAAENGWLLVNTHITNGWNNDFTRINEFISHCKEKGFEFMTLGEAWRVHKPIYDWYDTF